MTRPHRLAPLLALVVAGAVAACSQAQPGTPPPTLVTATASATMTPTGTITTTPSPSSAPSASTPPVGCQSGTVVLQIRSGPAPAPLCLRPGARIQFTAESSPRQPWRPLTSSTPEVVRCDSHPAVEGSIAGECTALAGGSATLRTWTAPFEGDPHGPPQAMWVLTVTVTA